MGLIDSLNKRTAEQSISDPNQLSQQELEYLLTVLKNSTIRGDQVEFFYSLVVKLQNQYITLTK